MRIAFLVGVTLVLFGASVQGDEKDAPKFPSEKQLRALQDTLRPPTVQVLFWMEDGPLQVAEPNRDLRKEIADLRQSLKGDTSDAPRYGSLGLLHHAIGEEEASQAAFMKAAELFRQQLAAEPNNVELMMVLVEALRRTKQWKDLETVLRQAPKVAPNTSEVWENLGSFLKDRALDEMFGGPGETPENLSEGDLCKRAQEGHIPRAFADKADERLNEAAQCYDTAVEMAPNEGESFLARGTFWAWQRELRLAITMARGRQSGSLKPRIPQAVLYDCRHALSLGLDNPVDIYGIAMWEGAAGKAEMQEGPPRPVEPALWELLPEENRESILRVMEQLKKVSAQSDKGNAVQALCCLANIQVFFLDDLDTAERNVHTSLELEPMNEAGWQLLTGILISQKKEEKCLEVCLERVKHCNCALAQLILGHTYDLLGQFDSAEIHYRVALKMQPGHVLANLSLTSILLKRARDKRAREEALEQLERTVKLFAENTPQQQQIDLAAVVGVAKAISGHRQEAKQILEQVLSRDATHETAREALQIVRE
jgi:tetratricopeptide (TPR) repeat protein